MTSSISRTIEDNENTQYGTREKGDNGNHPISKDDIQYQNILSKYGLYHYKMTNMYTNLALVNYSTTGNNNYQTMFNEETLFHYCNLLLDTYDNGSLNLAMFRSVDNYGPKRSNIDIYFHPFLWEDEWHLAIGFTKYKKILFIHCSDYTNNAGIEDNNNNDNTISNNNSKQASYPSFSMKTSIVIKQFIIFFKQKLSKNSLKYPRLFTDLFEPCTPYNAINLLTIIFSFCLDPVSLMRSLCDPEFSPRKFDISDMYPVIDTIDKDFREEYLNEISKLEKEKEMERVELEKATSEEVKNVKSADNENSRQKREAERKEWEKKELEKKRQIVEQNELKEKEYLQKASQMKRRDDSKDADNISKRPKRTLRPKGTLSAPIEINDLDSEEEEDNLGGDVENESSKSATKVVTAGNDDKNFHIKTDRKSIESEKKKSDEDHENNKNGDEKTSAAKTNISPDNDDYDGNDDSKKLHQANLKKIFLPKYSIVFKKYILNRTLFTDTKKIDLIFHLIKEFCYSSTTNPKAFNSKTNKLIKPPIELRNSLFVSYRRRMKQEFDESLLEEILKTDYKNQIIPLIFENGSVFLINIKTNDNFNCIIKLVCVSNRSNRSEREIMKNYAFRRLVEMYVTKFNRLVTKIRCSIINVKNTSFFKVSMQAFYALHYMLWKNKIDLTFKPKAENLESYTLFFERILESAEQGNMFKTELNFKRLIKHVVLEEKDDVI